MADSESVFPPGTERDVKTCGVLIDYNVFSRTEIRDHLSEKLGITVQEAESRYLEVKDNLERWQMPRRMEPGDVQSPPRHRGSE